MTNDTLRAVWRSDEPVQKEILMTTLDAVLEEDRADQQRERWLRLGAMLVLGLLCPALLWFAAFGRAPLVRGGYALMAAGAAVAIFAEWMHRGWSRQALPGPRDTRSQLQKTAVMLSYEATYLKACALWCAPVLVGAALIGGWVYQERSQTTGVLLWIVLAALWAVASSSNMAKGRKLDARRARLEELLKELT
jgi:hypothetical protein